MLCIFDAKGKLRCVSNRSRLTYKTRDILRPEMAQAETRETDAEIRNVPGNTGRLATIFEHLLFVSEFSSKRLDFCHMRCVQ